MTDPTFVHLRLHSEYSVVDGIVRIDDAIGRAEEDRMPALALTDLNNLFGMVKFYKAARGSGIKPIAGADVWISNEDNRDQPHRLLLLCQSKTGYLNLCELMSRAYRHNQYKGRAEIMKSWLGGEASGDLIALSGAMQGDIGQAILQNHPEQARQFASEWQQKFPNRFYIEIQRAGHAQQEAYIAQAVQLAAGLGLPVVATHPIQFMQPDDFKAHEARVCIAEGYVLADPRRPRTFTTQQYFKTQAEMAALFHDLPQALANSVEIAKRCNITVELGKNYLPLFPTPEGMTLDDYLVHRAKEGLNERLAVLYPDPVEREKVRPMYDERLEFEYKTILQMGFPGYFLIVSDFIQWGKDNGVPVGPGRGSGAGSLVAYCLKITDLDPTKYDLLFERFLNPERVSMPDFDVDFCMDNRERVIDYVKHKYGIESVSQIATFGTMAAKAVIRDVGRVLDLGYGFVDSLAKLIPNELGITLAKAREMEPLIDERAKNEEEVAELLALAEKLEGMTRGVGMHAGGVLISPGKITDFCPVYIASGSDSVVSQFDKDDVEQVGLVKFDFLGLRTLTILDWAMKFLKDLGVEPFDLNNLPLDDKKTYDLLKRCDTTAVFQLESRGMKDLIKRLQPDRFEDVVALVALFRPGPLGSGMVDDFINRKHGRQKADYFHPKLEETLKSTYGIILYQEQVMLIAQILAGYSLGGADMLRRAMGKKKAEEMAKHREIFTKGATERGVDPALAGNLFDLMEKFAEYGFNKSHSAAYALVAYQTAYLKAHYPAAFMASTISSDMDDTDKVRIFYEDCRDSGLTMLPPDVNLSDYRFVPVSMQEIRYGLGGVKGVGENAIQSILDARTAGGPFKSLFDFCNRVDRRAVNKRTVEALVRAGAFDAMEPNRASLLASVGMAMEAAEQAARSANQSSLFKMFEDEPGHALSLVNVPAWNEKEKLQNEKLSLGYYFSGHPFGAYRKELAGLVKTRLGELSPQPQPLLLAGVIYAVRTVMTRRGKMGIVALDDGTAQMEAVVFSEVFDQNRAILKEDQLLIIEGKVSEDKFSGGLRITAERLYDLSSARTHFARSMHLCVTGHADAARLVDLLGPFRLPGGCPVSLEYQNQVARCELQLGADWRVELHDNLVASLADWLGEEQIKITYQYTPPEVKRRFTGTDD